MYTKSYKFTRYIQNTKRRPGGGGPGPAARGRAGLPPPSRRLVFCIYIYIYIYIHVYIYIYNILLISYVSFVNMFKFGHNDFM